MADVEIDDELFWEVAEVFLARGADRSTMMGYPCLRRGGKFFASLDRRTGDLIAKLPKDRVDELIESDVGGPFAPAGRRFKEWVVVEKRDFELWQALFDEAYEFVGD